MGLQKKTPSAFEVKYRERDSRARKKARQTEPGRWVERERVVPVVLAWIDRHDREHASKVISKAVVSKKPTMGDTGISENVGSTTGRSRLCFAANLSDRGLWRLLFARPKWVAPRKNRVGSVAEGERFVSIDTVDRLFVAMDCVNLFYLSREDGGFADVYFHPAIVDAPVPADEIEVEATPVYAVDVPYLSLVVDDDDVERERDEMDELLDEVFGVAA